MTSFTENPGLSSQQAGGGSETLPNSVAILVLGILSIVGCFCYGTVGIICGIIALILASKANQLYKKEPGRYSSASYNNMNAGRICAIIGLILSALYLLLVLIIILFGMSMALFPWENFGNQY